MSRKDLKKDASARQPINDPLPDWAPLWKAPFFCLSDGRLHNAETWPEAFCREVRQLTGSLHHGRQLHPRLLKYGWPKWSVTIQNNRKDIPIDAMGVSTTVAPGFVGMTAKAGSSGGWFLSNRHPDFLAAPSWDKGIPETDKDAAFVHKIMLTDLFRRLRANFAWAIEFGAAHVMARPRSVLAPFERIAWDQWRFFKQEIDYLEVLERPVAWQDARIPSFILAEMLPATAISPDGERLYSIYVAPGHERTESKGMTAEDQCQQWLLELLREYRDQRPCPLQKLCQDAVLKFPGLTKRGFDRALMLAQARSGNRKWSEPGAPRKIPASIPVGQK